MDAYDPHEQQHPNHVPAAGPAAGFPDGAWRKPSACGPNSGNCVEVNLAGDGLVGVRDSKIGDSPVLVFDRGEWARFTEAVRRGEFDG
ncbi:MULTISPECIES: DUF397 domain-containing protein [Amycolatopsis]|uniref:DUF397 domain-containing protein n=1 Tax=Amycolatopsis TaxID=1813 RepID=UPI001F299FFD|nr:MULTISPECIES: DUF397 domain-containing protein [Amycolatopsis]UKD59374.1 DUF397 domain-containing protein [Amycolatopsis sp. FU40]